MIIIGITGTLGAGKGTIVEYLVGKKGFTHFSVRAFLIDEIIKRGMIVNRDNMVIVANELRAKHSPSYITEQLFVQASKSGNNCVIESIRTPGEAEELKKKGNFYLIAVDADRTTRYERIHKRQSETDNISFETFLDNEEREMKSTDPNKQNIMSCMGMSDFVLFNNRTVEDLQKIVDTIISQILK
jgi:dephospho-CoA kinase